MVTLSPTSSAAGMIPRRGRVSNRQSIAFFASLRETFASLDSRIVSSLLFMFRSFAGLESDSFGLAAHPAGEWGIRMAGNCGNDIRKLRECQSPRRMGPPDLR